MAPSSVGEIQIKERKQEKYTKIAVINKKKKISNLALQEVKHLFDSGEKIFSVQLHRSLTGKHAVHPGSNTEVTMTSLCMSLAQFSSPAFHCSSWH